MPNQGPYGQAPSYQNDLIRDLYGRRGDPSYGLEQFQRIAASQSRPDSAYGGPGRSAAQRMEAREADDARNRGSSFDAFKQFRLGVEGQQGDLLGLLSQNQQFYDAFRYDRKRAKKEDLLGFIDQLIATGGGIAAARAGGGG